MSGTSDKFKGKAKELTGKIMGDESREAEGKADQIKGELKDRAEDAKDSAGDKVNDTLDGVRDKFDGNDDHNK